MAEKFLIGLDFGSDSVRAVLVSSSGNMVATAVHPYARWKEGRYSDPAISMFRQHPLDYLEGVEDTVRSVLAESGIEPALVAGIGVDCTGSTPCAVDANGTPLALLPEFAEDPDAMFLLWKDHTSLAEADRINEICKRGDFPDYTRYSGGRCSPEWFWSKLLHILRVNPKVRGAIHSFVEHCDWITAELTGCAVKPSRCAAGHKALWHGEWGGLPPEEFFAAVDPLLVPVRRNLYTETYTADTPVGKLSAKWAEKLGLTTETVVAVGAIDCHVGAVGAGIKPGNMVKVVGTSTCDILVAPGVDHCIPGICGQVEGSVLPGLTGLEAGQCAFGDIYAWFTRFLSYAGKVSLPDLEREAAALPDSPVMALDWMNGRRTPDANELLTGSIYGLNLGTTPPMVFRALVESTAFGARAIIDRYEREGLHVESVTAVGGIARKSSFVMQFLADAMNMPIRVAASDQAVALGAAMFGAAASGVHKDIFAAMDAMKPGCDAEYLPRRDCTERYQKYLRLAAASEREIMS